MKIIVEDICDYQFQVCDFCLTSDEVLIPDCTCGRSICTECLNQQLPISYPCVQTPSAVFYSDENIKLLCHYCIRKENFCWFCRLGASDTQHPLIKCYHCFIAYHYACADSFGISKCPMHRCNKCNVPFLHENMDPMIYMSCYVCLKSFHVECFKGMYLDCEQRISACVCDRCLARIGVSSAIGNKKYVAKWIKHRRQYDMMVSASVFLLYNRVFSPTVSRWLSDFKEQIMYSCKYSTASHEYYLSAITTTACQYQNQQYYEVLLNLLEHCDCYAQWLHDGLQMGFVHKIAMAFTVFYSFLINKPPSEIQIDQFGMSFIVEQYALLQQLMAAGSKKARAYKQQETQFSKNGHLHEFKHRGADSLVKCLQAIPKNQEMYYPTLIQFRENQLPKMQNLLRENPQRACNTIYRAVFSSERKIAMLEFMLRNATHKYVDDLVLMLLLCHAVLMRASGGLEAVQCYFAPQYFTAVCRFCLNDTEPAQKVYPVSAPVSGESRQEYALESGTVLDLCGYEPIIAQPESSTCMFDSDEEETAPTYYSPRQSTLPITETEECIVFQDNIDYYATAFRNNIKTTESSALATSKLSQVSQKQASFEASAYSLYEDEPNSNLVEASEANQIKKEVAARAMAAYNTGQYKSVVIVESDGNDNVEEKYTDANQKQRQHSDFPTVENWYQKAYHSVVNYTGYLQ